MTRRTKHVVASAIVLSAYHRLNNAEFIIRSYLSHHHADRGDRLPAAFPKNHATLPSPEDKKDSGSYNVGEYSPYCSYNEMNLCSDQINYMISAYKMTEEEAKSTDDIRYRCRVPPIIHVDYSEEEEPFLLFHAGPHKTGTTALQAFIYDLIYKNDTIFPRDNFRIPSYDELPGVFGKEGVGLNLPHCSIKDYRAGGGNMNVGEVLCLSYHMNILIPSYCDLTFIDFGQA